MPSNGSSNSLVWVLYWTALPGNSAGGAWMQHRHHRGGECWGVEAKESQIQQRWYFCIFHTQHIHSSTHIHTTWDPSSRIGLNAGGGRLSPLREALLSSLTLSETLLQLNWLSSVSSVSPLHRVLHASGARRPSAVQVCRCGPLSHQEAANPQRVSSLHGEDILNVL